MAKPTPVLAVVLPLAFAIRLAVALAFPNIVAFDEVFQNLEQAHRLVFGPGIVPWEYQVGLRSWLIPLLLAGPMELAHLGSANPLVGLLAIRVLLVLASLSIVWCATIGGETFFGRQGAWIAGLFAALWPDLWLMAPHPLEEVLAADLLVPAIFLVEAAPASLRKVALGGFLLGLCLVLRLQLAPAIALAGIALCKRDPARWQVGLFAGVLPVLLAGGLDWITWGEPFRSFYLNVYLNIFRGVAAEEFGASPAWFFPFIMGLAWLWTLPVMIFFTWRGAKILPVAGFAILLIFAAHSLISHKEFRFVFPAVALAVPLAGIGLAGFYEKLVRPIPARHYLAAVLAFSGPFCSPWLYFLLMLQTNSFHVFEALKAKRPSLVAIGPWEASFLPLDVLLPGTTRLTDMTVFKQPAPRPDFVLATVNSIPPPPGYQILACHRGHWNPVLRSSGIGFCLWARAIPAAPVDARGPAPPLMFPMPDAARPFIIRPPAEAAAGTMAGRG